VKQPQNKLSIEKYDQYETVAAPDELQESSQEPGLIDGGPPPVVEPRDIDKRVAGYNEEEKDI